jgi:hypothetical protein
MHTTSHDNPVQYATRLRYFLCKRSMCLLSQTKRRLLATTRCPSRCLQDQTFVAIERSMTLSFWGRSLKAYQPGGLGFHLSRPDGHKLCHLTKKSSAKRKDVTIFRSGEDLVAVICLDGTIEFVRFVPNSSARANRGSEQTRYARFKATGYDQRPLAQNTTPISFQPQPPSQELECLSLIIILPGSETDKTPYYQGVELYVLVISINTGICCCYMNKEYRTSLMKRFNNKAKGNI